MAVTGRISFAKNVLALEVELVEGFGELHEVGERHSEPLGSGITHTLFQAKTGETFLEWGNSKLRRKFLGGFGQHGAVGARRRGLANEVDGVGVVLARAVDLQLKFFSVFVVVHGSRPGNLMREA